MQGTRSGWIVTIVEENNGEIQLMVSVSVVITLFTFIDHSSHMYLSALLRHDKYNKRYVPVKWSRALKKEAEVWAVKLAEQCDLEHDKNT